MKRNSARDRGKHIEIHLEKQKNVGLNAMEFAALNKRKSAREGLELVREKQEVNRQTKQTEAQNKTKPLEKAWN